MASFHNVTNQKSSDFEDTTYDPDIEARLYAEIYYSNETYAEDSHCARFNATASIVDNVTSSSSTKASSVTNAIDAHPPQNKENNLPTDNFVQDRQEDLNEIGQFNFVKPFCPAKNWIIDEVPLKFPNPLKYGELGRKYPPRHRLLAHEGLWSKPEVTRDHNRTCENLVNNVCDSHLESPETTRNHNKATGSEEISFTERLPETSGANHQIIDKRLNDHRHEESQKKVANKRKTKKREKRNKQENKRTSGQILTKAFSGTKKLRCNRDEIDNVGVSTEASKYNIVGKKNKLKMRQMCEESVEISSDSDDSILEVPIPPKAPPPVILLPDSDDESGKMARNETSSDIRGKKSNESLRDENNESTPCYSVDMDSSDESLARPTRDSSPLSLREIGQEASQNESMNHETTENNFESTNDESDNLILNCTDIQRGASSLEEIRKIREGFSNHGHSDDSMTESEATNWVNIAAKQADMTRDRENLTIDGTMEINNSSLWDQFISENNARTGDKNEKLLNLKNNTNIAKNCSNLSINNDDTVTKRKRHEIGESSTSREFSVPEIPEKRTKRKTDKTSADKALSEYFFKPMSKEMQSFYNNPWGGENLDVFNIQSRMPRNSSCWTILDSDFRGAPTKRRRACPRCKTDSHYGKRCPEKSKPPCCSMCGITGHTETRCPQTMCLTCGNKYATYRPTCGYCSKLFCNMCHGTGHTNENCPDLWRRYHNTTTETLPVVPRDPANIMKAPQYLSCCNCAKRGHDVTMCRQLRWSQHFTTPMYISSYTDGPIYPLSLQERIQATNYSDFLDFTDVPNNRDAPQTEFSNLPSQARLIIEYGKFDDSSLARERTMTKRLDQLKNVYLNGLMSGESEPTFLQTWQENFVFNVQITHEPDDIVLLVIQASNKERLNCLENIIMQWLSRRDNEREYLVYDELPYNDIPKMMIELKKKLVILSKLLHPTMLVEKIAAINEAETGAIDKNRRYGVKHKSRKWQEKMERQSQLVASLYRRSWVEGGEKMVQTFRERVRELDGKHQITIENYMKIVYLYNEIFTYRESEELTKALEKAVPTKFPQVSFNPPFDSNDRDNRKFENSLISSANNFYIDCFPNTSNFFSDDEKPGNSRTMVNFAGTQNYNFISPLMSNEPFSLDGSNLQNSQSTLLLNHYGKKKKKQNGQKQQPCNNGLLKNLTKKKRKVLRRSARKVIEVAKSSCLTHLQKMGNDLKIKLHNNSIRTEDVQLLRRMLRNTFNQQKSTMRRKSRASRKAETDAEQKSKNFCKAL